MTIENSCLFCKIFKGEIPSKKVFENEWVIGFHDLYPQAPVHLIFIHKEHTTSAQTMALEHPEHLAFIYKAIAQYASTSGLAQAGYRVVTNVGKGGGQSIFHTHFHVLSQMEPNTL